MVSAAGQLMVSITEPQRTNPAARHSLASFRRRAKRCFANAWLHPAGPTTPPDL